MKVSRGCDVSVSALDLAAVAAECLTVTDLQVHLLPALARVLRADQVGYHQGLAASIGPTYDEFIVSPQAQDFIGPLADFASVSGHSPILLHLADPSASPVVSLRELVSARAWHENPVYRECFRNLGIEDHLVSIVGVRDGVVHGVTLTRDANPFDAQDRRLMTMIRRHLQAALRRCLTQQLPYETIQMAPRARLTTRIGPAFPTRAAPNRLTARESEVLALVAGGLDNQQVSRRLRIARRTVDKHLENAFAKLGAQNRVEAIVLAREPSAPFLPFGADADG